MKMIIRLPLAAGLLVAFLSTGCASIKMMPTESTRTVPPGKALVTFARPAVFFADGMPIDLWDGTHFIGVLKSGTIVQYEATPGEHLFMARSEENWSYASGTVTEGKRYYLKANFFPGFLAAHVALGIADRTDPRIDQWHELKARAPSEQARAKFESTKQANVRKRIQDFRDGDVKSFVKITDEQAF